MRKRIITVIIACLPLIFTLGCWDIKEIQSIYYVSALGIDYVDDRFVVYAQMIDLSQVAKSEGQMERKPLTWLGIEEGLHLEQAIRHLYLTSQQHLFWDHLNGIILHERVLQNKKHIDGVIDFIRRYREIRMNALIYGTSGNFEQLLATNSLFEFSPLFTILLNPIDNFRQYSVLPPVEIREFIAENNRTFRTHVLPSLKINEDTWKNEEAPHPVLEVSGAYLMNSYNYKGFLPIADLLGVRWMTEKTVRANLDFKADGEFLGSLNVMHPKVKIKPTSTTREQYSVELKMEGTIMDEKMNTPESEIDELARRSLIEQVQNTFDKAQRLNADIYNLRDSLFSRNPKAIKTLSQDGTKPLPEDALNLKANVQVVYSGKYKVRAK